jgi:hypothetical protein
LAPYVEQARARAKARDALDKESELSDLRSSDFEDITLGAVDVKAGRKGKGDSMVIRDNEVKVEAPTSPNLPLRPKRARVAPARYRD